MPLVNYAVGQNVAAGKTSATFIGLKAGKSAWVEVRALNSAGGATYSGILTRASSPVKIASTKAKAQSVCTQSTRGTLTVTSI